MAGKLEDRLGENLKARMALRNVSPKDLATLSGVSLHGVYHVMKAERWPNPDTLARLASALATTPAALLAEPVAQDKPDLLASFRVVQEFLSSLDPLRIGLLERAASMDDAQVTRYLAMIREELDARAEVLGDARHGKKKALNTG